MADTYAYLIHEADWDSDAFLGGAPTAGAGPAGKDPGAPGEAPATEGGSFPEHAAFQKAVADLGARIVGGAALQHTGHGGTVTPGTGDGDGRVEDAVYTDGPFPDSSEVITGFYLVETDDEDTARRIAALVPTSGHTEWRKVFPTGM